MFGLVSPGVAVRDRGDFERSDIADERFVEVRRSAGSIAAVSGCAAGSPFASPGACTCQWSFVEKQRTDNYYLPSRPLSSCLNAISTLDHVGFQADGTRSAV